MEALKKYGYDLRGAKNSMRDVFHAESVLTLREPKMGQTGIHLAVKKGHLDVLGKLCDLKNSKECINVQDRHGNTALHFGASSSAGTALEMVEMLMRHDANGDVVNKQGQTPLATHLLTIKEDVGKMTALFCRWKVPLNGLVNGETYLHMAIKRKLKGIARVLVSQGASIHVQNANGKSIADIVERKMFVQFCRVLVPSQQRRLTKCSTCQLCNASPKLLQQHTDCKHCGRIVCKSCSAKETNLKIQAVHPKSTNRFCNTCATVLQLQQMQNKSRSNCQVRMFGCTFNEH